MGARYGVSGAEGVGRAEDGKGHTISSITIVSVVHDPPGQTARVRPRCTVATTG